MEHRNQSHPNPGLRGHGKPCTSRLKPHQVWRGVYRGKVEEPDGEGHVHGHGVDPRAEGDGRAAAGGNCIEIGLPGKLILRDYFQENRSSNRPTIIEDQFSGKTYFYTSHPRKGRSARRSSGGRTSCHSFLGLAHNFYILHNLHNSAQMIHFPVCCKWFSSLHILFTLEWHRTRS